jgi:hemerythrin-like domain-containing protein
MRAQAPEALDALSRLEADHRAADPLHESVERLYREWIRNGTLDAHQERQLAADTSRLKQLYAAHIAIEEDQVFPGAARALDAGEIAAMGAEFRQRRM